ncbi:MAG: hypothetical protein K0R98_776 [Rickettsiaceae bacterium]|jgi:predicted DNA binding CopG/RHH family protein|nr:hypothetical protein [Rickettsiaceae bacterium]
MSIDKDEKAIENAIEAGEFIETDEFNTIALEAAENYLKKSERINIRLSPHDLHYIKAIASEEGIPYQTLVSSVLHKYIKSKFNQDSKF